MIKIKIHEEFANTDEIANTLDQPISDEELGIEKETKFVYGAPRMTPNQRVMKTIIYP